MVALCLLVLIITVLKSTGSKIESIPGSLCMFCTKRPLHRNSTNTRTAMVKTFVPNIIHQVFMYSQNDPIDFPQFLSMKSIIKFQNPNKHYVWVPLDLFDRWKKEQFMNSPLLWRKEIGEWIQSGKVEIKEYNFTKVAPNSNVTATRLEHVSDFARYEVLSTYGGIYLDFDVFLLQSLDPLRKYKFVLPYESTIWTTQANSGIILSELNSLFLKNWISSYSTFSNFEWDLHSSQISYKLCKEQEDACRIEKRRLSIVFKHSYNMACGILDAENEEVWYPKAHVRQNQHSWATPFNWLFSNHATSADKYEVANAFPPSNETLKVDKNGLRYFLDQQENRLHVRNYYFDFQNGTRSHKLYLFLQRHLALHFTGVPKHFWRHKGLVSPDDFKLMPSPVGHMLRMIYYGYDNFNYESLLQGSEENRANMFYKCVDHFYIDWNPYDPLAGRKDRQQKQP